MTDLDWTHRELALEKARSDASRHAVLPRAVADELKPNGKFAPRFSLSASVVFADIKDFTRFTEQTAPAVLIDLPKKCFALL